MERERATGTGPTAAVTAADGPRAIEPTDVLAPRPMFAGKYRMGKLLGEGGMGSVYEAVHVQLGARVAVKLLSDAIAADAAAVARFRREARAAAAVRHDNVVAVTDAGTDDEGTPFLVMERLEGESLGGLLKRERTLSPARAVAIADQVLAGLGAAHARGVVHRDLKPANVFLERCEDGGARAKILDFGVSKLAADVGPALTATGAAVGTPHYMPPEQVCGDRSLDHRADIYAVGAMLYRMVTGKLAFPINDGDRRRRAILSGDYTRPRALRADVPEALERVIQTAMELDPARRFDSARAFRAALRVAVPGACSTASRPLVSAPSHGAVAPPHRPARARRWIAAAVAALLIAGGAVVAAKDRAAPAPAAAAAEPAPLRIGMTMYVPREIQQREYGGIARWLEDQVGRPVELAIYEDSQELLERYAAGDVDLAALNPHAYVEARRAAPGTRLLATPVTAGGASFEVHIVARADSELDALEDLRGKVFCYVPSAASGYLFPRALLAASGLDPDTSFRATRLARDHLAALRHVQAGRCDATAVYAGLLYAAGDHGLSPHAFRVLATTDRIPNDAYCAHPSLPRPLVEDLRAALLSLQPGSEAAGEAFAQTHELIGFAAADDSAYDTVREAEDALAAR